MPLALQHFLESGASDCVRLPKCERLNLLNSLMTMISSCTVILNSIERGGGEVPRREIILAKMRSVCEKRRKGDEYFVQLGFTSVMSLRTQSLS